jgi:NAD+ synthase
MEYGHGALELDLEVETERICTFIQDQVVAKYKRKGVVVGLSGGVDSALLACLCVRALGRDKVFGVLLPEKESSPESASFAAEHAEKLGIRTETINITPVLTAFGVYEKRNRVVKALCPDFDPETDTMKIVLPPDLLHHDGLNIFSLIVGRPDGGQLSFRLKPRQIHEIVAAQNVKQRTRMIQLYFEAERRHFIVGGTTNRTETAQGFFVKYGDGGVDMEPMSHLYKTQIFKLAKHLGVTRNIIERSPSPDTYPGGSTDEEFFFRMPFDDLDLLLVAWEKGLSTDDVCRTLNYSPEQVLRAFRDFQSKWNTSWHMRAMPPSLPEENTQIDPAIDTSQTGQE